MTNARRPVFADIMTLQPIGLLLSKPFYEQYAEQYNVTINEWRVIVVVHGQPGIPGHEVGRIAGLIPMNVSRAVTSLRKAERIRAEPDPENRRQYALCLTAKGKAVFDAIYPLAQEYGEKFFAIFSLEERVQFSDMLQRLYENAEALLGD